MEDGATYEVLKKGKKYYIMQLTLLLYSLSILTLFMFEFFRVDGC
jgi:hypothetical protein